MSGSMFAVRSKQSMWLAALCASAALLSSTAFADNDKHRGDGGKSRGERWSQERHHDRRDERRHDGRSSWRDDDHRRWNDDNRRGRDWDRRSDWRDDRRHYDSRYRGRDWRYHQGRYWAPAYYRGRQCDDRRHFHGVHYHVAASDYYDYYYPRYRYYGARPYGANASVIISIPLF
jgi:hypothetical protein